MATGTIRAQEVLGNTKCDICDTYKDVLWRCFNCQETLCDQCQTYHSKSRATRDHTLTELANINDENQGTSIFCQDHENEAFLKYCTSCKVLVCLECIIGAHRQHEFKHIEDIIKQNRTQVEEVFEQIKTKNIPELEQSIVSITQKEETYSQEIKNMIAKMTTRGNHLKQATDTLIDAIRNELMQQATKDKNRLKATKKQIDQNLKTLKTQLSEQEQRVQKFNGIDTIVNAADIMTSLSKVTSFIVEIPSVQPPGFQTGEDNDENLKNMIGQLLLKKSLSEYPLKAEDQTRFPADPDVKIRATFNNKTSHNRTRYDQKNWHRFDQEFVDRLPEKDENKNAKLKKDKEKSYRENSIFYDT